MPVSSNTDLPGEASMQAEVLTAIRSAIPPGWKVERRNSQVVYRPNRLAPDLLLEVRSPDNVRGRIAVEVKTAALPARISDFVRQVQQYALPNAVPLLVAPYIGPRARALLRQSGVGFWDMTGNAELALSRPGLAIRLVGASSDPWKIARPVRSLKGPKAARVVRALCDWRPPQGVRELAGRADVSAGYVSRVLATLEEDALIRRALPKSLAEDTDWTSRTTLERRGPVVDVDWQALLRRWTDDYGLLKSNEVTRWLEPRGPVEFLRRVRATRRTYAITGSTASAAAVAAIAPAQLVVCFTDDPSGLATEVGLREVMGAGNVFLVRPFDTVMLARARVIGGISYAAVSQTLADLLTSPGRASAETDLLTGWMTKNERTWRT